MSVTGNPGDDPVYMGFPMGDVGGGWGLAFGVLAALHERSRTGEGKRVDISMLDMQVSFQAHLGAFYLASGETPQPIGSGHPSNIPAKALRASDRRWVQIHCSTEPFWFKTADMIAAVVPGFDDLPDDPRFKTATGRMEHRSRPRRPPCAGHTHEDTGRMERPVRRMGRARRSHQRHRRCVPEPPGAAPQHARGDRPPHSRALQNVRQPHQGGSGGALHPASSPRSAHA